MSRFTPPPSSDFDNENEQIWKAVNVGDHIEGIVTERKLVTRQDGTDVELLKVDDGDVTWVVWCSSIRLRDGLEAHDPQPGDKVGIQFDGKKAVGKGHMNEYGWYCDKNGTKPTAVKVAKAVKPRNVASGADGPLEADDGDPF
jgi:hypothetical protein